MYGPLEYKKGIILFTSILLALVLIVIIIAYISSVVTQRNLQERHLDSLQAFYLAEKGVAFAVYENRYQEL